MPAGPRRLIEQEEPMLAAVDFRTGWATVWGDIEGAVGSQLTTLMTGIGVVLVVGAILRWLWDRRRGGMSGNHSGLLWTLGIGAVLAAPDVVIPMLLGIADMVTNAIVGFFGNA